MQTNHNPDIKLICIVKFFRGKRKEFPDLNSGKYCPHFIIKDDVRYLGICFIDGQEADFDTWIKCCISLLYKDMNYSELVLGTKFNIMEGPNVVGEGVVDDIVSKKWLNDIGFSVTFQVVHS